MERAERIDRILAEMTLKEKIALCSGENTWETKKFDKYGIPSMFMCDGPHGLRKQEKKKKTDILGINESNPATCFPAAVTTAGSWDAELLREVGKAIAEEAKNEHVGMVLGPGINMKRNPLCGRNFEYFSEDPVLAGELAAGYIAGMENEGIACSLKHFACNSQEYRRLTSDGVIDDRTLREIYLAGFERAVKKAHPATLMCSYPKLNGTHASDHKELLTDILRDEWGFDGLVVTDWGAMNDRIECFKAGCDLGMPGGSAYMEKDALKAVKNGMLSEEEINKSARRVLELVLRAEETLSAYDRETPLEPGSGDEKNAIVGESGNAAAIAEMYEKHHALAAKAAEKGIVLLKNEDQMLPLNSGDQIPPINCEEPKLAIIGSMAKNLRIQGAGSSHINPTRTESPLDFFPGASYAAGCDEEGATTEELLNEVRETAQKAEKVIVFAGLPARYESEGFDRENMKMPEGHLQMIAAAAEANPNTIVVLVCGSAVECPWADRVKAIVYAGLPGQGGARAIARILKGEANPCGKLAESWPFVYEDVPSSEIFAKTKDALYEEGLYIGYRYYEKAKVNVRWPFGFGLSYTTFSYTNLTADGRHISVNVKNTGKVPGEETVQLYVGRTEQTAVHRPVRELKGFTKVSLVPGEEKTVEFDLTDRDFSVWQDGWKIESGEYRISVGNESVTILEANKASREAYEAGPNKAEEAALSCGAEETALSGEKAEDRDWYWTLAGKPSRADWEKVIGHPYVEKTPKKGEFTMDSTIVEMKDDSLVMRIMYTATETVIAKQYGGKKDYTNPDFRMMMESSVGGPLRSIQIFANIKGGLFEGLLEMANGHFFKGVAKFFK